MMKFSTAVARIPSAGLLLSLAVSAAAQQAYPSKPIRFIVPFPPGGSTNVVARLVGQKLTETLGQPVIVDNRPGGNTIIGTEALVKAAPDGYTILLTTSTLVISPHLLSNLPYDPIKDFAAVAGLTQSELVMLVHALVPANSLQEFIALARSKPGQLNYASAGSGGLQHLAGELFNIMAGVKMQHIPYKGGNPAMADLLGGQVQMHFTSPINVIANIKAGKLKALAISGDTRLPALPQVPSFTEAGLPGFRAMNWLGVTVPVGTSRGIIGKLSTEISRILALPETRDKLTSMGSGPLIASPEQLAALMKAELIMYGKIIKAANIKLE